MPVQHKVRQCPYRTRPDSACTTQGHSAGTAQGQTVPVQYKATVPVQHKARRCPYSTRPDIACTAQGRHTMLFNSLIISLTDGHNEQLLNRFINNAQSVDLYFVHINTKRFFSEALQSYTVFACKFAATDSTRVGTNKIFANNL
jgi:hypothetical protein